VHQELSLFMLLAVAAIWNAPPVSHSVVSAYPSTHSSINWKLSLSPATLLLFAHLFIHDNDNRALGEVKRRSFGGW